MLVMKAQRSEGHDTHLGSSISAFSQLGALTAPQIPKCLHGLLRQLRYHLQLWLQHQPGCAWLCPGAAGQGAWGSSPQLHARTDNPESPTHGTEQIGTVTTWLPFIRFWCISDLVHLGGNVTRGNAFLQKV